jgi:hypothetical protein
MPSDSFKSVTVRMKSEDLAILNQTLQIDGYETIGDAVRDYIRGTFSFTEKSIQRLAAVLSPNVVKMLSNKHTDFEIMRNHTALSRQ